MVANSIDIIHQLTHKYIYKNVKVYFLIDILFVLDFQNHYVFI